VNSIVSKYQKVLSTTRAGDWRFSFIPFIFGNLYLWLSILEIEFSFSAIFLLILSLTTSLGFAALGYFINEFFDKEEDAKAGKINNLSLLSTQKQAALFLIIVALTFLPWIWIPKNIYSLYLIIIQVGLFLAYSMPPIRIKHIPYLSAFVDAGYAYIVPMLLSFYSFALFSEEVRHLKIIGFYAFLLLIVGFRNITIHHINDIFKDKRNGFITLPRILGVVNTDKLLKLLIIFELVVVFAWILLITNINWKYSLLFFPLIYSLYSGLMNYKVMEDNLIVNNSIRHTTDSFYQLWFPIIALLILIFDNLNWIFIIPIHAILFVSGDVLSEFYDLLIRIWADYTRPILSFVINYTIYFLFLLFTVDLIKENKSALEYLNYRFRKNKTNQEAKDHDNS
jgi:4-hydroxybenzoate polyprenyltransferase